MEFHRLIRRLHETAELVGSILDSDSRVEYDGQLASTHGTPGLDFDVPIYTSALGEAARRATGRVADGWIPHNIPFDQYESAFETIARTARKRGRDPGDITVVPYVPCAVSDDEQEARDAIRGHLAYYIGSGKGYQNAVGMSFLEEADRIAKAWEDGDRERGRSLVTGKMIDCLSVAGTPESAPERFGDVLPHDVIDGACVVVPENASRTRRADG